MHQTAYCSLDRDPCLTNCFLSLEPHLAQEGEETLTLPVMKMAVLGNMWTNALPSVREFFEHAAQRKSAWEDARALEAESKVFYPATPVSIRHNMRQDQCRSGVKIGEICADGLICC